jgi:hypothetical protein
LLHKLKEEFFPDDMTESNTFHILGESFFITKKDPDGESRKLWNAYNWETRNRIVSRGVKEEVIRLVAEYYTTYYRWDDYLSVRELQFSPPIKPVRKDGR